LSELDCSFTAVKASSLNDWPRPKTKDISISIPRDPWNNLILQIRSFITIFYFLCLSIKLYFLIR